MDDRKTDRQWRDGATAPSDQNADDLEARETRAAAIEAAHAERKQTAERVLSDADERDHRAEDRDSAADERDLSANLQSWLSEDDESGAGFSARQSAAKDRSDSRADRTSSAVDRFNLAEDDDPRHPD